MKNITGPTGSGKNSWLHRYLLPFVVAGTHWVTYFAPHPRTVRHFIAEAYAILGESLIPRLVVERLSDTRRVIMRSIVHQSESTSHYEQRRENDLALGWFLETLAYNRPDFQNPIGRPVLYRYATLAYRAFQYSSVWMPNSWMPFVLQHRHPVQDLAIATCTNPTVRAELERIRTFSMHDQMSLLWPIENLLTPFVQNAALEARFSRPARWDKRAEMSRGLIHIIMADGISLEGQRMFFAQDFEATNEAAKLGVDLPGKYAVDEMSLLGMTQSFVVREATMRDFGVEIISLNQFLHTETPEILEGHLQNTDHLWPPQASSLTADLCLKDMRGLLDRNAIHHYQATSRQVSRLEWIERSTETEAKGPNGTTKSKSKTLVPVSIPEVVTEYRPVYESGRDQEFWKLSEIMSAPIGTMFLKPRMQAPRVEIFRDFPNSWGFDEVREARFQECLRKAMQKNIFEEPIVNPFPVVAAPTTNTGRRGGRRRSR